MFVCYVGVFYGSPCHFGQTGFILLLLQSIHLYQNPKNVYIFCWIMQQIGVIFRNLRMIFVLLNLQMNLLKNGINAIIYIYCSPYATQCNTGVPALFGAIMKHMRSEEHTSELQSLMLISSVVFCLKKKTI